MARESSNLILGWPDRYGREQVRTVNHVLNIEDFKETPGFAWLVIAANPHLSATEIQALLKLTGEQHWRSASWIGRHRWLFKAGGKPGAKRNLDGLDDRAHRIMQENPRLSCRQMAYLLRQRGVPRSAEWVRKNRVQARVGR